MMRAFTHEVLHDHQRQVNQLLTTMERLRTIAANQALTNLPDELAQRIKALHDNQLTILFTGAICSGKRTIINAFLGQRLLPLYPIPLLGVPTIIFWGEQPEAHIHYRPRPDDTTRATHTVKLANLERDLLDALTTTLKTKEGYECIVIQYPHPLLEQGLTLIDLPCRTTPRRHSRKIAHIQQMMHYLQKADAVVYVRDCSVPPTKDEDLLIECIRHAGHSAPFFLCNQIDRVDPQHLRQLRMRTVLRLRHLTSAGDQHIFFTNASAALSARLHDQPELLMQSKIPAVEFALANFLMTRWQERFNDLLTILRDDVLTAIHLLEQREQALQGSKNQLDHSTLRTYLRGFECIADLTMLCGHIMEPGLQRRTTFMRKFATVAGAYHARVLAKIGTWTQQYVPGPVTKHEYNYVGNPRERFVKGLSVFLSQQVRTEAHEWLMNNCYPLLKEELATIARLNEKPIEQFIRLQHEFQYALQGSNTEQGQEKAFDVLDQAVWQITQEQQAGEEASEIIALIEQDMNATWPILVLIEDMLAYVRACFAATTVQQDDEQAIRQLVGTYYHELLQEALPAGHRHIQDFVTNILDRKQARLIAQLQLFEESLHTTVIKQIDAHHSEAHQRQQVLECLEQDIAKLWNMYLEIDERGERTAIL